MREDIHLRFALVDRLMRLPYGHTYGIGADKAAQAWPPTGDADPSMEAGLLAMAVAAYGGAPISSYTTQERIANDLDESFAPPEFIPYSHPPVWRIHRKVSACPKCCGTGWHRVYPTTEALDLAVGDDMLTATDTVKVKTEKCNHQVAY